MAGLTGLLAKTISIEAMPVLLLVANTSIFVLNEVMVRRADAPPAAVFLPRWTPIASPRRGGSAC